MAPMSLLWGQSQALLQISLPHCLCRLEVEKGAWLGDSSPVPSWGQKQSKALFQLPLPPGCSCLGIRCWAAGVGFSSPPLAQPVEGLRKGHGLGNRRTVALWKKNPGFPILILPAYTVAKEYCRRINLN